MGDKYPILRPNEITSALSKKGFIFKSQKVVTRNIQMASKL